MQRYFAINKNLELSTDDIHHIINVMRMKENDSINIIYESMMYECILQSVLKKDIKYKVVNTIKLNNKKDKRIVLAAALIKEQKYDYVLQKATELGVDEIIPLNTDRSIIKIDSKSEETKLNRWRKICKEASEQSHRLDVPIISNIMDIKTLLLNKQNINILCSVNEMSKSIKEVLQGKDNYDTLLIVIGPEGGFTLKEENLMIENGFLSVTLGDNILRAETASLYILSVINYEFMR